MILKGLYVIADYLAFVFIKFSRISNLFVKLTVSKLSEHLL